jgi:DNA-binding NtrC family response regulator
MISTYQTPKRSKIAPAVRGRILLACEDILIAGELAAVFGRANLRSERAMDFKSACKLLKSGRFQVAFATPGVPGGSWEKLMDFARDTGQAVLFVIVARSFDLSDWGNCLKKGAFDVLDSISEISKAGEVAMQAFSAAHASVGQVSAQRKSVELHDLSAFNAKYPEITT